MARIGLLGGTFDPIHLGHIALGQSAYQQLGLDRIWLLPNAQPPHKQRTIATLTQRHAMLKLAIEHFPEFELCDIEQHLPQPSYSSQTLNALRNQYPEHQFYFIMGMDSLLSLPRWHQWQQLLSLCQLAVFNRPEHPLTQAHRQALPALIQQQLQGDNPSIHLLAMPAHAISSTQIRHALGQGNFSEAFVPKAVHRYICQQQLYQG